MSEKHMHNHWAVKIWEDGRYFDLWHLNHFLAGLLLASTGILLGVDFWLNLLVSSLAMIAWEVFEIVRNIEETNFNRAADVILGVMAFFLTYDIDLSLEALTVFYVTVFIFWLIVELWGFWAYKVRGGNHSY